MGDFFHSYVSLFFHFPFLLSHFCLFYLFCFAVMIVCLKIFWCFAINIVFLRQDKGDAFIATSSIQIDIVQIIGGNE